MLELNKIYCGDCLELMKDIPDGSIDCVVTDPPYGIGKLWVGGKGHGWANSWAQGVKRNEWDGECPPQKYFDEIFRISNHQIIWGGNYFNLPTSRGWLVWNKPERNFTLAEAELAWTSRDMVIRVCDCHRSDTGRNHPTQKPIDLMLWCMSFIPDNCTILDPFLGSGTTAVAALKTDRNFIGIELDPKYCEIAQKRVDAELAQTKLNL